MVDAFPKFLELFLIKVLVEIILFNLCLLTVLNHTCKCGFIKDSLHKRMYTLCHRCKVFRQRSKRSHFQIYAILVRNLAVHINILVGNQIELDSVCRLIINNSGLTVRLDKLAFEIFAGSSRRSVIQNFLDVRLQVSHKALVALACDNRQLVNIVDYVSEDFRIHSVACLVYAETQTSTDLLSLLCGAVAVFQRTNLEHIRIIPPLTQSGM